MVFVKGKKTYELREGSRAQVFHGTAYKTKGGLTKGKLFKDKNGNIKSKKASEAAKKTDNLGDLKAKKGSFGPNHSGRNTV